MKIRIVSDLHTDINKYILSKEQFGFLREDVIRDTDVLCICGDLSGSYDDARRTIDKIHSEVLASDPSTYVLFTMGNHESYASKEEDLGRNEIANKLHQEYRDSGLYFLEGDWININSTIFMGACLHTCFAYSEYSIRTATKCINDFKYNYMRKGDNLVRVTPSDYSCNYANTLRNFERTLEEFKECQFVILTHFAPSYKSIHKDYRDSAINDFYCSDLEGFIERHPNIKVWAHGHVHDRFNYKIGETEILCSPYGYYGYDPRTVTPSEYWGMVIEL